MNRFIQTENVVTQISTTSSCQNAIKNSLVCLVGWNLILPESTVFSHFDTDLRCLKSQFTSWYQNQTLNIWTRSINAKKYFSDTIKVFRILPFNKRNQIGSRFTSSVFGTGKNITTGKSYWDWSFLNWGWNFPSKKVWLESVLGCTDRLTLFHKFPSKAHASSTYLRSWHLLC